MAGSGLASEIEEPKGERGHRPGPREAPVPESVIARSPQGDAASPAGPGVADEIACPRSQDAHDLDAQAHGSNRMIARICALMIVLGAEWWVASRCICNSAAATSS